MTRYYDGAARWARFDAMTPEQRERERADMETDRASSDRAALEDYAEALERKARAAESAKMTNLQEEGR